VPLAFTLVRYQQVLKTVGVVRAGAPLGGDVLAIAREPAVTASGLFLSTLAQVEGQIARRDLQSNQRLTLGDIARPAIIRRGEICTVVLTRGRVRVTVKAIANHDAPAGGAITLTNLQSRAQISGTAAARGTVVVGDEGGRR